MSLKEDSYCFDFGSNFLAKFFFSNKYKKLNVYSRDPYIRQLIHSHSRFVIFWLAPMIIWCLMFFCITFALSHVLNVYA